MSLGKMVLHLLKLRKCSGLAQKEASIKSHPATLSSEKQIPSAKSAKKPADSTIQTSGGEESLATGGWDVSAV